MIAALVLPSSVDAEQWSLMAIHDGGCGDFENINNLNFNSEKSCRAEGERLSERHRTWKYHCFKGDN